MSDTIADLIIRLKNANLVDKEEVVIPHSKFKEQVLGVIRNEGFISEISVKSIKKKKFIFVYLSKRGFNHIRRISKPGKRHYVKSKEIPRPLRGFGLVVISTPAGLLSGSEARKSGVGGELICEIW